MPRKMGIYLVFRKKIGFTMLFSEKHSQNRGKGLKLCLKRGFEGKNISNIKK